MREECRKYEEEGRWRVSPIKVAAMAAILVAVFIIFHRPWNYLVMIVLLLAEGMYVWNRIKEGKKKPKSEMKEEQKKVLDKLLNGRKNICRES